ncbi:MAG: hypothetical protein WHX93_04065 [bacterium]
MFDKGMNAEENLAFFDTRGQIHFITTYSPYFVEDLATIDPKHFQVLDTPKNQKLRAMGREEDQLLGYRCCRELWGQPRTVVVTFNPITKRKKLHDFQRKMAELRVELLEYRRKYRQKQPQWRSPKQIATRYRRLCDHLHIGHRFYKLSFTKDAMSFTKDLGEIHHTQAMMGKSIIVTDHHDWSTEQIVQACLDRYCIEKQFRVSKAPCHIRINPLFHWTDSKIRCHLLTCVMAMAALRLVELKVGGGLSGRAIMEEMHSLNRVISLYPQARTPEVRVDDPTPLQEQILAALGYRFKDGWVLQA